MKIRLEKGGPVVGSPSRIRDDFTSVTEARQADWERRLTQNPAVRRGCQRGRSTAGGTPTAGVALGGQPGRNSSGAGLAARESEILKKKIELALRSA